MGSNEIDVSNHPDLLDSAEVADLRALARALYPHRGLADAPYQRTVARIAAEAFSDATLLHLLRDGLADLRAAMGGSLQTRAEDELRVALTQREATPFFSALRSRVAWHLYDDHEVWAFIGYPGASFDRGGYVHRGFDDLTWLPEPRIDENESPMPESRTLDAAASFDAVSGSTR